MTDFIYETPVKIYFGKNQLHNLSAELAVYGKKVLLTYGGGSVKKTGLYDEVVTQLKQNGFEIYDLPGIEPNPRVDSVRKGAQICKENGVDVILAIGGGSVIDASKWIAAGACVDFDVWDFFSSSAVPHKALPLVTILTLAATGSEMNMNGVISNPETNEKKGCASPLLYPKVSFLNPELTYSVNRYQTACGSADIMSHIMETYFNDSDGMYLLDSFMETMMKTVIRYTPVALEKPDDYEARANLMWTSSWAISRFSRACQTCKWSCHSMEHELSAFYDITHGLGLAILTPRWMRYCLCEENVGRYVKFGVNVFGIDSTLAPMEIAELAIAKLEEFFFETLGLDDSFAKIGIGEELFETMAKKACKGSTINGFKTLTPADVVNIYKMCL